MKNLFLVGILVLVSAFHLSAQEKASNDGFYNTDKVQNIEIQFEQKNWPNVLDSLRLYGNGTLKGKVTINGKSYQNVGVRYRGSKSFKTGNKRNALHLKLNAVDKAQNHQGFKTIKLSNALRDPSMVREVLSYEIARKYMPAPQANYANVTINGELYGVFINVQPIDEVFLEENFNSSDHTFVKCSPNEEMKPIRGCKNNIYASLEHDLKLECYERNFELKSEKGWEDLMELTKTLNSKPTEIANILHVDRALWMLAFNNVLVNLNSYSGHNSQNYYLYKDNTGRFNPIIWDLNLSFGSFKNIGSGSDLKLKELQTLDPFLHENNPTKPLVSQLLKNDFYKKIYLSHVRTIVWDNFVSGDYEKRAEELQRLIQVQYSNDPNKYYEFDDFKKSLKQTIGKRSQIPGIEELMSKRARYLKKHPKLFVSPPTISNVKVLDRAQFQRNEVAAFQIQAKVEKYAKKVSVYYRFGKDDNYTAARMMDDGKSNDMDAGDKVFGVKIDPKGQAGSLEYFILAEDAGSISYDPPAYMLSPHVVNLKDLN